MATTNPFSELMTPGGLNESRKVDFEKRYQGADFWVYEAADAGRRARASMLEQGIALTPEDERAITADSIMKSASAKASEALTSGKLKQNDAQKFMIENAMNAFVASGDYEAASQLAPALRSIYAAEAEMAKLASETSENQADELKALTEAGKLEVLTPLDADLKMAQAEKERALAGKYGREPVVRGGTGKAGEKGGLTDAASVKWGQQLAGARGAVRRLNDIFSLVVENPGIGGDAAATLAGVQNAVKGTTALARTTASPEDIAYDDGVMKEEESAIKGVYDSAKRKGKLPNNVEYTRFKSLTIDLAYALAKARDPGGRLSNADVENALQIIGVAGDPEAMVRNLKDLTDRTIADITDIRDSYAGFQGEEFQGGWDNLQAEYGRFQTTVNNFARKPSSGPTSRNSRTRAAPGNFVAVEEGVHKGTIGGEEVVVTNVLRKGP